MLLIDLLGGVSWRIFGLLIKSIFVITYSLSLFPEWLNTTAIAPLVFAILVSSAVWIYIERDIFSDPKNESLEPVVDKHIYGKWFSREAPFAPLEGGGYFCEKQILSIDKICQISAEAKNRLSLYSDRMQTIELYIGLGIFSLVVASPLLINFLPELAGWDMFILGEVLFIGIFAINKFFYQSLKEKISVVVAILCDCMDSIISLEMLLDREDL
jgi:hypothetical protein